MLAHWIESDPHKRQGIRPHTERRREMTTERFTRMLAKQAADGPKHSSGRKEQGG
jgi:hypothetical protein